MRIFIDTANVAEIRDANDMGFVSGVTTNPSLIAREGRDFVEVVREILTIVDGPVSAEVLAADAAGMIGEASALRRQLPDDRLTIKIPMTAEGLKAVKVLSAEGFHTNVTLVFSAAQALLAARAGTTYVSPFIGRVDDIAGDGCALVAEIAQIFRLHQIPTQIIAASIRSPLHAVNAAKAGADIATVPYKVLRQMLAHPLTDAGIAKFNADWAAAGMAH